MNFLLRLFPSYAALEVKCAAQAEQIGVLEEKCLMSEARCDDIRRIADAAWLTLTGRSIFGLTSEKMPLPPDYKEPEPVYSAARTTKAVQAEAAAIAQAKLQKFFEN